MHEIRQTSGGELAALRLAFALVRQPIFILDARSGRIVEANPAGCQAMSLARGKLIGQLWQSVVGNLESPESREIEIQGRRYVIAVHESVSTESRRDTATRDVLTGLPNRQALFDRFAQDASSPSRGRLSLMFIDLDGFKQVNDAWGHVFGDRVLQIVAQRLMGSIRKSDLVVRYGGDEFIVVVEGACRRHALEQHARQIALALQIPILIEGRELLLSASIGIARHEPHLTSAEALIAEADRAMYRVKSNRRNNAATAHAGATVVSVAQQRRRLA